ncbi:MAG: hypothetical protein MUE78_01250 [Ilumatobacteraceae bacterium]|jgi:uncharacterized protein YukE|nr:hypothetical protein [Ilumatobacteraceae bacterium]
MTMYGANPEQLAQLGRTLTNQIAAIDQVIASVDAALAGTTWQGPARQRFEHEWTGSFTHALHRLEEAFSVAGRDCIARSDELQRVMGA